MRETGGGPGPGYSGEAGGGQIPTGPQEEGKPVEEYPLSYSIVAETGKVVCKGEGKGVLEDKNLVLMPKFGEVISFSFRDIVEINAKNYKLNILLTSKEKLTISDLGYDYENFLRVLTRLRNEVLLKDLLMHESLKKSDVEASFVHSEEDGKVRKGVCKVRLYETGLVVIPEEGEMFRIPYSDLREISEQRLGLALTTEFGEKLSLSKMGAELDPFKKVLSDINNELQLRVLSSLRELIPSASSTSLRMAARLMKEGRAARRKDVEAIDPKLWAELEKKLDSLGVKEFYDFLKGLSQKDRVCIGVKRGLMGDLTGEYVWFLIPIYDIDPKKLGNAVAMEATSEEGGGKATYFFRLVSRKDYPKFKKLEDLHKEADKFIQTINRCMLAINFRREPIYLSDERLEEPQYLKYKFAVQKLLSLQTLRKLFIGRVIHATPEQWKRDVMDLLEFNVSTENDSLKWQRSAGEKFEVIEGA